ncbi:MAG: GTPase [Bacilli bacterium]|nr:GTPase [Bacilli bacterium]
MTKCKGCGIELQNKNKDTIGYTDNLNNKLCNRCFKLTNYGEYSKVSFTNKDYNKLLETIPEDSLVIYTTDILSLDLDRINKYKNILLIVTKRDIMPKSLKDEKIINYIKNNTNYKNILIISSKKNYNIDTLYNYLKENSNNKPIYFVGDTNSGKSTLINKLIKNYSNNKDNNITVSMYPSTTLSLVPIKINNLTIIDTPGIINPNNIINYLEKSDIKKITQTKEIKPKSCQITGQGSIVIDKYLRIDYETEEKNSLVIYSSNNLNIRFNSLKKDYLKDLKKHSYILTGQEDIVIPGLCFIKISKKIKLKIYINSKITPIIRNKII